jgi:signal transduction histidine kinase
MIYGLLFGIAVLLIHRYQKDRFIRKEKEKAQKKELEHAVEIEKAYTDLKATQIQLIQKEKMASLGELTAGIAHEIQNPLNFVNNFSEVNNELIDEMKDELTHGNNEEAIAIADDVKQNLEKIYHHGKRADAIVKGMLQHSRINSGQKEFIDINALADEYLRLSYHGLRAKDKSFNADFKTDFDPNLPKIEVVPQDMGRVLLNLINNAFYAVNEKAKLYVKDKLHVLQQFQPLVNGDFYIPMVTVNTRLKENAIEISIEDNGQGIPDHIKDKIFQPFFTTKPTGQGTGLGLSLAYDIVKAHGGEIILNSETSIDLE